MGFRDVKRSNQEKAVRKARLEKNKLKPKTLTALEKEKRDKPGKVEARKQIRAKRKAAKPRSKKVIENKQVEQFIKDKGI